jgi:hypothetical protein
MKNPETLEQWKSRFTHHCAIKKNKNMSEIKVPTFDELVKTELTKFDAVIPKIEELKAQFLPLTIIDFNDTDGYKAVAEALKFVVKRRTSIEDKRKELKADSLAYGKAVDARAREITQMLSPIEEHLREQKEKVDNELIRIETEKETEKQLVIQNRHKSLLDVGMQLIGNEYINYNYPEYSSFPVINLETLSEEDFDSHIAILKNLHNLEEFKRIGEEKRIAEEKAKFEEEQAKLKEEQEAVYQEKLQMRLEVLTNLGCSVSNITDFIFYKSISVVTTNEIKLMTIQEWSSKLAEIKERIAKFEQNIVDEALEIERLQKQKEDEEVKAKLAMIANMKEKEKIAYYATQLLKVERPEMNTLKWNNELKKMITFISNYIESDEK